MPICLAREGWAFYKLITHLERKGLIALSTSPVYLKVSRTLLFRCLLGNSSAWRIALESKFKGKVIDLLMKRFGLQFHEAFSVLPSEVLDFYVDLPNDIENLCLWFEPHNERLAALVEPTKIAVLEYFRCEGLHDNKFFPLMIDLGYAGTIQKIITSFIDRDTSGLYFIASNSGDTEVGKRKARMTGVFRENVNWSEGYLMLERSLFLESLMTAPHGQVIDIRLRADRDFDFYYGRLAAPQRFYQDLEAILQGAVEGVEEGFRLDIAYSLDEIEELFAKFVTPPSAIPKAAWHLFTIDDDFSGNGLINPTQIFGF